MTSLSPNCARCSIPVASRVCKTVSGRHPDNCPTVAADYPHTTTTEEYRASENHLFAQNASRQEKDGYRNTELGYEKIRPAKTRLEETLEFISRMEYRKIGLAFCIGLRKEAAVLESLLRNRKFDVISAICKVGRVPKHELGLSVEETVCSTTSEPMCNPILQAEILNNEETELNILLGLCVGHDSLFLKYAEAPCTVFAVKDRVSGHNPLAAIYTLDSYYRALK